MALQAKFLGERFAGERGYWAIPKPRCFLQWIPKGTNHLSLQSFKTIGQRAMLHYPKEECESLYPLLRGRMTRTNHLDAVAQIEKCNQWHGSCT